ncbi:MAG: PAS domain-containing sensor histidine kinase [Phormidesmis sp. FL-bin-119]|nr:PAS domain-containing sensor histidine kinase [Pedobacter sp.]
MDTNPANIFAKMIMLSEEVYFTYNVEERRIEYLNPAFEKITYLKSELVLNNPSLLFLIIHQDDHIFLRDKLENLVNDKHPTSVSFRIIRKEGEQRWIKLNICPIVTDENVCYLTGLAEDDTPRRASLLNMEKVTAWQGASLEILAHDLRAPIGSMKMLAAIIAKKLQDNQEVVKLTEMIEKIAQKNINLIQSLLRKEQLLTEALEIKTERLDVVWEINQAIAMYIESEENLQKHINFTYSQGKIYAELDSLKFLQVINNLVSNAIKFTNEYGSITIHLEKLENTFLLSVQDDGIGIPKNLQPYLFQKYTEAGRTGINGQESVGLGMWIVKSVVEAHHGKIWFESTEGSGSTFYVEMPIDSPSMGPIKEIIL